MAKVFPAQVGMSPLTRTTLITILSVPRVSGDEPSAAWLTENGVPCSPHERG